MNISETLEMCVIPQAVWCRARQVVLAQVDANIKVGGPVLETGHVRCPAAGQHRALRRKHAVTASALVAPARWQRACAPCSAAGSVQSGRRQLQSAARGACAVLIPCGARRWWC